MKGGISNGIMKRKTASGGSGVSKGEGGGFPSSFNEASGIETTEWEQEGRGEREEAIEQN